MWSRTMTAAYQALCNLGADPQSTAISMRKIERDGSGVIKYGQLAYAYLGNNEWESFPPENVI